MSGAIVSGALATKAGNGGNAWSRITLVHGLRLLGFDVLFLEQLDDPTEDQRSYFERVCSAFGIDGHLVTGDPREELVDQAQGADLLLNVGGHLRAEPLRNAARVTVYLDDDPGYTQFWHADGLLGDVLEHHDYHFTYGVNIGRSDCAIRTGEIRWRPTRPPVVLEQWPVRKHVDDGRFTTVGSWRGAYGRVEHNGHVYGQKAHEFRKLADLPRESGRTFELALDIDQADAEDAELLRRGGWELVDPRRVAAEPGDFRTYVQGSGAEFSVAQGIYVETASGWFSDRSVCYLASGKPVVIQDTGFGDELRGAGVLAFETRAEALAAVEEVASDYERHARAARALAEEHFDSNRVLGELLEQVL
jgi:hypothetical protein